MTTGPDARTTEERARAARASLAARISLLVILAGVVAALVFDPGDVLVVEEDVVATGTPTSGSSTCAVLDVGDEDGSLSVATSYDAPEGVGTREPAASLLARDGRRTSALVTPDLEGRVRAQTVDPSDTSIVTGRWEGTGMLLGRRVAPGEGARVAGAVEGTCPAEPATRWLVPGVATAGGASAELHLANPTAGSASVTVTLTTPEGRIEPTRLANVVVTAGQRVVLDLNEFAPEEPDLGIEVTSRSGRVVVEALQVVEAAVGDVDGRSLVTAHTAPAEVWTVPWVESAAGDSTWLWVTNPGERSTDVRLVVHGADGPVVPPGGGLTVAGGTTQRLDLRGVLAERGGVGVTLRATDGVPVVVSGAVLRSAAESPSDDVTDDGTTDGADVEAEVEDLGDEDVLAARGGIAVVEAVPATDRSMAALSLVTDGRERSVVVVNPGDAAAVVEVRVLGRAPSATTVLADELTIAAGSTATVPVGDAAAGDALAVVVRPVQGAVAAALVGATASGPLELTATSLRSYVGEDVDVLEGVRRDRSLLHPIDLAPHRGAGDPDEDVDDAPPVVDPGPATGEPTESPTSSAAS